MANKTQKKLHKKLSSTKLISILFLLIIVISFLVGYLFNQVNLIKKVQDFQINQKTETHISTTNPPIKNYKLGKALHWTTFTDLNYGLVFNYPNYLTEINYNFPAIAPEAGKPEHNITISNKDSSSQLQIYLNPRFGGTCNPTYFYDAIQTNGSFNLTYTKEKSESLGPEVCTDIFYSSIIKLENGITLLMIFSDGNRQNEEDFEGILGSFWVRNATK